MLVHLRSEQFKPDYLKYVHQDPVHSLTESRSLERRCRFDRNIFFWIENDVPTAVLCVAFIKGLTDNIDDILDQNSDVCLDADHAIFYSVFRTNAVSGVQNTGAKLIREAAVWIKANMPHIKSYVTMSPIPNLSANFSQPPSVEDILEFLNAQKDPVAKFHLRNGARVLRIIPNADNSERRRTQSYSNMVNYDYTQNIIDA
mgnify:FL=1